MRSALNGYVDFVKPVSKLQTILCAALLGVAVCAQPGRSTDVVPPIVARTAQAYAAGLHGVIGMQRHFTTKIAGGPIHHTEESDSAQLIMDGRSVRIKYYRIVANGRPFSAQQLAQREEQANQQWADGKVFFKEPYDPHYVADYTYQEQADCADCTGHTVAVNFSSTFRDNQHGQGTMWIDTDTARVQRATYTPNALPPHATSGTVTEISSEPLPGFWYVTRIEQSFQGRAFVFKGKGTFEGTFDHFRRFPSADDGEVALKNNSI
jgi:hypothetical protein